MSCDEVNAKLEALFDGSLDSKSQETVEYHLSVCQKSQVDRHQMAELRRLLRRSMVVAPSDLLDERTMRAFDDRWKSRGAAGAKTPWWKRRITIPVPAFGLALALLVAIISLVTLLNRPGDKSSKRMVPETSAKNAPAADSVRGVIDLSRFDHGERAIIYVERNSNPQSVER